MRGTVVAVARDNRHRFTKPTVGEIQILAGLGVKGDAHSGVTVRHRSRVAVDPTQPNLRQVHLIPSELFSELSASGFDISAGDLGENITSAGIDLLALPVGTVLHIGASVALRLTGLRNPCSQIDAFRKGLLTQVIEKAPDGQMIRKAGVMAIVDVGGSVRPRDSVDAVLPAQPHRRLERV